MNPLATLSQSLPALNQKSGLDALPEAAASAADLPTPENTPLPGGGSWRWDMSLPGWATDLATNTFSQE